jgi:ABC-type transport system involved in cytochrome bd biosynthesis fused ATPase/permease subunit
MGISATSLVGTPLLLSTKADQQPAPNTVTKAANALNEPATEIQANLQGTLYSNSKASDAKITDLFQGDEVGNTASIDVSKLQMFYVTVVSLVAYAYALYSAIGSIYPQEGFAMPVPSTALVALLGISNAAYLTNKTVQHS